MNIPRPTVRNWSPFELNVMLHHYVSSSEWPNPGKTYDEAVSQLIKADLLTTSNGPELEPTPRGLAFIELLMRTPRPELVFIDPHTGDRLERE